MSWIVNKHYDEKCRNLPAEHLRDPMTIALGLGEMGPPNISPTSRRNQSSRHSEFTKLTPGFWCMSGRSSCISTASRQAWAMGAIAEVMA